MKDIFVKVYFRIFVPLPTIVIHPKLNANCLSISYRPMIIQML